jgi:hypothetical protein
MSPTDLPLCQRRHIARRRGKEMGAGMGNLALGEEIYQHLPAYRNGAA